MMAVALIAPPRTGADSASVVVTARIEPTFSLTLLSSGVVDFGTVSLGSTHLSREPQVLRVRSSRPWVLSDSSDRMIEIGDLTVDRESILRHAAPMDFDVVRDPGVHTIECLFELDLASPIAFDLPPDVEISTTFGYTALQR